MSKLFERPGVLIIVVLVLVVVFGASKLPVAAKSLGQSLRIFKNEIRPDDSKDKDAAPTDRTDTRSSGDDHVS